MLPRGAAMPDPSSPPRERKSAVFFLLLVPVLLANLGVHAMETFTNPVADAGADPWVIRWKDAYYYCRSAHGGICVARTTKLHELGQAKLVKVWAPAPKTFAPPSLWAPELHYLEGKWFIYVAADDGENARHRMYALEGTSQDPQGEYTLRGKVADKTNRWAIDGTVLALKGRLYFIWSGWEGDQNVEQNLYIAPMSNPWTIGGERVLLSRPEHEWERRGGRPWINEGPEVLEHDGRVFVIYSASGSWCDEYCLGQLALTGADPLKPEAWEKKKEPVFVKTADVFGPGHASFTLSPDGKESWIVYHTARRKGSGWDRQVRIQKFEYHADGTPSFGTPVSSGVALPVPSGTK
jgi:GH43 family beta-xylosidase